MCIVNPDDLRPLARNPTLRRSGAPSPHNWNHRWDCPGRRLIGSLNIRCKDDEVCEGACYSHFQCEPPRPNDYKVCGECGHIFRTQVALEMDEKAWRLSHNENFPDDPIDVDELPDAEKILSCPHCAHDF